MCWKGAEKMCVRNQGTLKSCLGDDYIWVFIDRVDRALI